MTTTISNFTSDQLFFEKFDNHFLSKHINVFYTTKKLPSRIICFMFKRWIGSQYFFCNLDVTWHAAIGSNDAKRGRVIFPPGALLIFVVVDAIFRCAHRSITLLAHSYQLLALGKPSFLRFYQKNLCKHARTR